MHSGGLIVIEGPDGVGKQTQTKRLIKSLRGADRSVAAIAFPRYDKVSAAPVAAYLKEAFGKLHEVDAYQTSVLFGIDRMCAAREIQSLLEKGHFVVLDRYMFSNLPHQGAKISDPVQREVFYEWLWDFEFNKMKCVRPDLNIVLSCDAATRLKKINERGLDLDIHELDTDYQTKVSLLYDQLAVRYAGQGIVKVECGDPEAESGMREIDAIHQDVWAAVLKKFPHVYEL